MIAFEDPLSPGECRGGTFSGMDMPVQAHCSSYVRWQDPV